MWLSFVMAASPVFQVLLFTDDETFLRTCKKTLQDMIPPIKIKHCHYGTFPKLKKEPIILIYDESTAAKGIEELVQLKNKFPDIGILVYFRENTDFLISLINQPVTFRCISFPVKSSTLQTELKKLLLSYERKKRKRAGYSKKKIKNSAWLVKSEKVYFQILLRTGKIWISSFIANQQGMWEEICLLITETETIGHSSVNILLQLEMFPEKEFQPLF